MHRGQPAKQKKKKEGEKAQHSQEMDGVCAASSAIPALPLGHAAASGALGRPTCHRHAWLHTQQQRGCTERLFSRQGSAARVACRCGAYSRPPWSSCCQTLSSPPPCLASTDAATHALLLPALPCPPQSPGLVGGGRCGPWKRCWCVPGQVGRRGPMRRASSRPPRAARCICSITAVTALGKRTSTNQATSTDSTDQHGSG